MVLRKLLTPVVAGFVAGKAINWAIGRNTAHKKKIHKDQKVDTSIDDSFPASDPPSWNAGHMVGAPKQPA